MLTKFETINSLGVFDNYRGSVEISDYGKFNILYGMNGSGKTTLSRFFASLNNGKSEEYPQLKFKIKASEGTFKEGDKYPCKIRVFNSDYVEKNLGEIEGQLNPIFIVGEENKSLVSQIIADEVEFQTLETELHEKETSQNKLVKDRGKQFTEIAKLIASDTSGQATRNYRKPDAEKAFIALDGEKNLDTETLSQHRAVLVQTSLDAVGKLVFSKIEISIGGVSKEYSMQDAISQIEQKTKNILAETSDSVAIQRLRDNPEIASWVESGLAIHKKYSSPTCEYCSQIIPETRVAAFGKHFNQSDQLLKRRINALIIEVTEVVLSLKTAICLPKSGLYKDLQSKYEATVKSYDTKKELLSNHLNEILDALNGKLQRRTEIVPDKLSIYDRSEFEAAVREINTHVNTHNLKTEKFEEYASCARSALESHHLSSIKQCIFQFDKEIQEIVERIAIVTNGDSGQSTVGIKSLKIQIEENKKKVSNTAKAATNLTDLLQTFLGRNDLNFVPEGDGYRIMREGKAAKRLSEGEKTAITFIYFIVQLNDQDFDIKNGIVVIDDPISSLDSNSTYQAFSFLKNAVKEAKQVFLFTHNFDFLKLLLNWCKNVPNKEGKKSYYMLLCVLNKNGERTAIIENLDRELLWNENEYSYLFKLLYSFESDGTIAGSYHIPNIARKVLETFLNFHYSGKDSMYKKLEKVSFDDRKKTALLKFANDLSHPTGKGFDPALVPETQNNVKYLLEMIKVVSPIHYNSIVKSITAN